MKGNSLEKKCNNFLVSLADVSEISVKFLDLQSNNICCPSWKEKTVFNRNLA